MHYKLKIKKLVTEHPQKTIEMLEDWYEKMPEQAEREIKNAIEGKHIRSLEEMNEGLNTIVAYNGNKAPFWTHSDFMQLAKQMGLTFDDKPYTEFDVDFLAQYYGADIKALKLDPKTCIETAIDILTDKDSKTDPSEKAYKELQERLI